jgi:hypothetical protein
MPMQDVFVEQLSGERLVVISQSAHAPAEELVIHVAMPDGLSTYRARVVSSKPISVAGVVSFRIELSLDRNNTPAECSH